MIKRTQSEAAHTARPAPKSGSRFSGVYHAQIHALLRDQVRPRRRITPQHSRPLLNLLETV